MYRSSVKSGGEINSLKKELELFHTAGHFEVKYEDNKASIDKAKQILQTVKFNQRRLPKCSDTEYIYHTKSLPSRYTFNDVISF